MPFVLLLVFFALAGCGPELMFGSVAGAGATLSKEKTVGESVDDYTIFTKIKASFLKHHKEVPGILTDVSIEVSEGRVLLTGKTNSADDRLKILKIVWDQNGVREVINEIKLDGDEVSNSTYMKDAWITTQVKSKFLANKLIRSINYNVETLNNNVYILGIARTDEELSQVLTEAESVKNVNRVVNYVKVKSAHQVTDKESEPSNNSDVIPSKDTMQHDHDIKTEPKNKSATISNSPKEDYIEDHEIEVGEDD